MVVSVESSRLGAYRDSNSRVARKGLRLLVQILVLLLKEKSAQCLIRWCLAMQMLMAISQ